MIFPTINYDILIRDLMPVLYKAKYKLDNNLFQLLRVLSKGVKVLYNDFVSYRYNINYEIQHNGQVFSLEHQLNDYFNLTFPTIENGSIWIEGVDRPDQLYLFNVSEELDPLFEETYLFDVSEESETYFTETYIYENNELSADYQDFIVHYPDIIVNVEDIDYIKSIVNKYKLLGYSYTLESYTII